MFYFTNYSQLQFCVQLLTKAMCQNLRFGGLIFAGAVWGIRKRMGVFPLEEDEYFQALEQKHICFIIIIKKES